MKKLTLAEFLFAITCSASQIVGVTVNSDSGQIGIFPVGPESLTIQYGTGNYQTVEGYEYSLGAVLPLPWNWPMVDLSLTEAAQYAVDCCEPNSLYDFEVAAALTEEAPSQNVQIAIWDVMNPQSGIPLTGGAYQDILGAEAVVNSGQLDAADFSVFSPLVNNGVSPSYIAQTGFPAPASTPEPAAGVMIGAALVGLGVVRRKRG
jgi:hypothetical protein